MTRGFGRVIGRLTSAPGRGWVLVSEACPQLRRGVMSDWLWIGSPGKPAGS